MKLLYRANSLEEANAIKSSLDLAGIPSIISGEHFSGLRIPFFPNNLGIFIYLDGQYDDALKVITDPDYEPASAINTEAFYQLLDSDEFKDEANTKYLVGLGWILGIVVILMFILNLLIY